MQLFSFAAGTRVGHVRSVPGFTWPLKHMYKTQRIVYLCSFSHFTNVVPTESQNLRNARSKGRGNTGTISLRRGFVRRFCPARVPFERVQRRTYYNSIFEHLQSPRQRDASDNRTPVKLRIHSELADHNVRQNGQFVVASCNGV